MARKTICLLIIGTCELEEKDMDSCSQEENFSEWQWPLGSRLTYSTMGDIWPCIP